MPAYYRATIEQFTSTDPEAVVGTLSAAIIGAHTGNFMSQLAAWRDQVTSLQRACSHLLSTTPRSKSWGIFLEYPMLRLQRRIDTIAALDTLIAIVEFKVGAQQFFAADVRQVEDYALDLRDFHEASASSTIVPILCATQAQRSHLQLGGPIGTVWPVQRCSSTDLPKLLSDLAITATQGDHPSAAAQQWDKSPYRPVPTIIGAAVLLYAGHHVSEIAAAKADQGRLQATANRLSEIVQLAKRESRRIVCFVTGIPGSGKTLVGLNLVHDPKLSQVEDLRTGLLLVQWTPT